MNHLIPDNVSITICGIQDNVSISICGIVSWIIQCCISYSGSLVVYTLCKRQLRYQIRIILANHSSTQWSVDKNIVLSLTHFCQIRHNRSLTHFCQIRHNRSLTYFCQIRHNPSKYCFAISIIIRKRNVINTNYFILIELTLRISTNPSDKQPKLSENAVKSLTKLTNHRIISWIVISDLR